MIKKELTFLIVFLISLPGCGGGSKKTSASKTKKMAQRGGGFSRVAIPLATDGADADSVRSFFDDDMQDFTAFGEGDTEQGTDRYSWLSNKTRNGFKVGYFEFDQYSVKPSERDKAKQNAEKIKQLVQTDKDVTVVVEGHACASAGSAAYNLALSEKRAKAYADFLQANGVPADRMKRVGRGNEMLVVKTGGRDEQWINRRVELHSVNENVTA